MARTSREFALSCVGVIILAGLLGLIYLIVGPNASQNPFIGIFVLLFMLFISCWLFGYIHPQRWRKKIKKRKEHTYIKEAPAVSKPVYLQEETPNVNKIVCPHCGVLQDQETKFCTKCGQKIE